MKHSNQRKQKIPFRYRVARFMSGRNGTDQLYMALSVVLFVLLVVNIFVNHWSLAIAELVLVFYLFFRAFSKNIYKRRRENDAFLRLIRKPTRFFKLQRSKWKDRKTHIYRKCPDCKNNLRLPKIKGAHTVPCPVCKRRFDIIVK